MAQNEVNNLTDVELFCILNLTGSWNLKCIDIGHWEVTWDDQNGCTRTGKTLQEALKKALKDRKQTEDENARMAGRY